MHTDGREYTKEEEKNIPFGPDGRQPVIYTNVERVRGYDEFKGVKAVRKTVQGNTHDAKSLKDFKLMCQKEAKIMRAARHSHTMNLITTYFFKQDDGHTLFCIVMDNADKGDLSSYFAGANTSQLEERWIGCLIGVVAYVHKLGIRHRDIKPQNVLVKGTEILLADFGISHMGLGVTSPTTFPGLSKSRTLTYCAPEVDEQQGRSRGRSADIFSLGAVVLEILLSKFYPGEFNSLKDLVDTKSYSENLSAVHALLDRMIVVNETTDVWRSRVLKICRNMLDEDRDERPLADKVEKEWKTTVPSNSNLSCTTCSSDIDRGNSQEKRLIKACEEERLADVMANLRTGVDPGATGAIHQAAVKGTDIIVKALLDAGADINSPDHAGQTALHYGALNGHLNVVTLLLHFKNKHGICISADVRVRDVEGQTALHCGAANGSTAIISLLVEKGSDISAADMDGRTALHYAARRGHAEAVQVLLRHEASIDEQDDNGLTAMDYAKAKNFTKVIKVLNCWSKKNTRSCRPS